eukprot:gene17392-19133_t
MGSHKSRKEKHKKAKKHRSRSRTRDVSKDDTTVTERRERSPSHSPDEEYQPSSSRRKGERNVEKVDKVSREEGERMQIDSKNENSSAQKDGNVSLSIEETNKLRIKLGLKPLQTNSSSQDSKDASYEDRADVHEPATNISTAQETDKLREKMKDIKEKRRMQKKLKNLYSLGSAEVDKEESANDWVQKMRDQQKQKEMADKRAKMLEDMEEDFGISDIMMEEFSGVTKKQTKEKYTAKNLAGLRIEHKNKEFTEGSSVIVTLKDQDVLDENEDVLENINLLENKKTLKNIENRKRKPDYRPYDEEEDDGTGLKVKGILEKYDDEDKNKEFIRLDRGGVADDEDEKELEKIRKNLIGQQLTLEMAAPSIAKDYYTQDEMVKFKKPSKKRRKIRKKEIVKPDDLLPLSEKSTQDHGSRKQQKEGASKQPSQLEINPNKPDKNAKMEVDITEEREFAQRMREVENAPVEDDEAEVELQMALERSRKSKIKKTQTSASFVAKLTNQNMEELESDESMGKMKSNGTMVLDSTSEFCRALGETPVLESIPKDIKEDDIEPDPEDIEEVEMEEETGGWEQVTEPIRKKKKEVQKYEAVLEEEPDLKVGVAAALKVASTKGFIEAQKKKANFPALNLPKAKSVVIDDEKMRDEARERHHRHDPYAFKDKDSYKPNVKLEYVDEHGHQMSEKEAFRFLSHKFHGKGSGKMKTEKRAKKLTEEKKLKNMSATDTPLNTAQMMSDRQQMSQTPYVVLSGGGKNLLST